MRDFTFVMSAKGNWSYIPTCHGCHVASRLQWCDWIYIPGRSGILLAIRVYVLMIISLNRLIQQQCLQGSTEDPGGGCQYDCWGESMHVWFSKRFKSFEAFQVSISHKQVFCFGGEQVEKSWALISFPEKAQNQESDWCSGLSCTIN